MTTKEFRERYSFKDGTCNELSDLIDKIASTVVIREYISGNSNDVRRETTLDEYRYLYALAEGALLAYRKDNADIDSILDTVEFVLHGLIPYANTYDSIYIPLRKITKTGLWED